MNHESQAVIRRTRLENESPEYLAHREQLRLAEIELRMQRKQVAELRRQLPKGARGADYAFIEGPADLNASDTPTRTLRLSELFTAVARHGSWPGALCSKAYAHDGATQPEFGRRNAIHQVEVEVV